MRRTSGCCHSQRSPTAISARRLRGPAVAASGAAVKGVRSFQMHHAEARWPSASMPNGTARPPCCSSQVPSAGPAMAAPEWPAWFWAMACGSCDVATTLGRAATSARLKNTMQMPCSTATV